MPRAPSPRRLPVVLVVILFVALAVGAAASALAGASVTSNPTGGAPSNVELTGSLVMYAFTAIVLGGAGFLLYRRLTSDTIEVPGSITAVVLVAILLLVLFVVVFHSATGGGPLPTNATGGSGPSNVTNTSGPTNSGNHSANGSGTVGTFWFKAPPWLLFVAVAVISGAIVVAVVPGVRALAAARGQRRPDDATVRAAGRARQMLLGAANALGEGRDPREVIVVLYAELLGRLGPIVGSLEPDTPEEIRVRHLVRLGIAPERSEALTRLFEEARYSTHPLGREAAERAEEVIRAAEADLARVMVAP